MKNLLSNFSELAQEYPILRKEDLCLTPWYSVVVDIDSAHFCVCNKNTGLHMFEKDWQYGPYVTDDVYEWWNCEEMVRDRKNMLERGCCDLCNDVKCSSINNKGFNHVFGQLNWISKTYGIEWSNLIIEDIINGKAILDHPPVLMSITVTTFCTNRCAFCFQPHDCDYSDKMLGHISKNANQCGSVILIGGELFDLPRNKLSILFSGLSNDLFIEMMSNGLHLTPDKYKAWVENGPIDSISISLNAMDSYFYTSGKIHEGLFRFRENMKSIHEIEKNHKIKRLACIVTRSIIPFMEEVVEFASEFDIPEVRFKLLKPRDMTERGMFSEDITFSGLTKEIYAEFLEEAEKINNRKDGKVYVRGLDTIKNIIEKRMSILHIGSMYDVVYGNMRLYDDHSGKSYICYDRAFNHSNNGGKSQ